MTNLESGMGDGEKVFVGFLILLVLATFAMIPQMHADKQKQLNEQWETKGCKMYDGDKIADVPAKCQSHFIDHYSPQERRKQP